MRPRFQRPRRREIGPWPADAEAPELVAARAQYVGSPEHKRHPSAAGPAELRSDATACEAARTRDVARNTAALREGIRRGCVSARFEGGFPRYVWTWIDGVLYEARHIHGPLGAYKGYRLEACEWPHDPEGRLQWGTP